MNSTDSSPVLHSEQLERIARTAWPGWLAVAAWVSVIFFTSTSLASRWAEAGYSYMSGALFGAPDSNLRQSPLMHLLADKGFHVAIFVVLAILLWSALPPVRSKFLVVVLSGAVVGSCSEFLQRFFPDRDPALRDVVINTAGTTLGALFCLALQAVAGKRAQAGSDS